MKKRPIKLNGILFYEDLNEARVGTRSIKLTPKEMDVFLLLHKNLGKTISRGEILRAVWGELYMNDLGLTQAISTLRKVFADDPKNPSVIRTIHKKGYVLIDKKKRSGLDHPTGAFRYVKASLTNSTIIILLLVICFLLLTIVPGDIRIRISKEPKATEVSYP